MEEVRTLAPPPAETLLDAVRGGDEAVVERLLETGRVCWTDVDGEPSGWNMAHHAIWADEPAVLDRLLRAGCPLCPLPRAAPPLDRLPPLHLAAFAKSRECSAVLLAHDVPVDAEDHIGRSPLHIAAAGGATNIVALLLKHGADPNKRDRTPSERVPLHYSLLANREQVGLLLLSYGARDLPNTKGNRPSDLLAKVDGGRMAQGVRSAFALHKAAVKIQAIVRGSRERSRRREARAAVRIQAVFRGRAARRRAAAMREQPHAVGDETRRRKVVKRVKVRERRGTRSRPTSPEDAEEELKAEELKAEEVKAEEVKAEEVKAEEVKAEKVKAEEVKAEELKDEAVKAEEVKTEEVKVKAEEVKAEEVKAEEVKAEEVKAEEVKVKTEEVKVKAEEVKAEVEDKAGTSDPRPPSRASSVDSADSLASLPSPEPPASPTTSSDPAPASSPPSPTPDSPAPASPAASSPAASTPRTTPRKRRRARAKARKQARADAATCIQAAWRGRAIRKRLFTPLPILSPPPSPPPKASERPQTQQARRKSAPPNQSRPVSRPRRSPYDPSVIVGGPSPTKRKAKREAARKEDIENRPPSLASEKRLNSPFRERNAGLHERAPPVRSMSRAMLRVESRPATRASSRPATRATTRRAQTALGTRRKASTGRQWDDTLTLPSQPPQPPPARELVNRTSSRKEWSATLRAAPSSARPRTAAVPRRPRTAAAESRLPRLAAGAPAPWDSSVDLPPPPRAPTVRGGARRPTRRRRKKDVEASMSAHQAAPPAHPRVGAPPSRVPSRIGLVDEEHHMRRAERLGEWNERFAELDLFFLKHGHCNVALGGKDARALAAWVEQQRSAVRDGRLDDSRKARLDSLNFLWDPPPGPDARELAQWERFFERVKDFHVAHGHSNATYAADSELANWLDEQREARHAGRLLEDQLQRLESVGMDWNMGM